MPRQIASVVADGLGRPQPFDLATDWPVVVGAVGTVLALWGRVLGGLLRADDPPPPG